MLLQQQDQLILNEQRRTIKKIEHKDVTFGKTIDLNEAQRIQQRNVK